MTGSSKLDSSTAKLNTSRNGCKPETVRKVEAENGRREETEGGRGQKPQGDKKPQQQGKKAKADQVEAAAEQPDGKPARPKANNRETARLRDRYYNEVRPALMKELGIENPMAAPKLEKIVVNMGVGEATQNAKVIDPAAMEVAQITGQKPIITKARKSIAAFKVREGMPIGVMVTLRGGTQQRGLHALSPEPDLGRLCVDLARSPRARPRAKRP